MNLRVLPKHTPSLGAGDFGVYLGAGLARRRHRSMSLETVWGDLLPGRRLFGTDSGRHALWHFLEAVNLPPGSEVLVGAYNYYVVIRILVERGLRPVFVDIEPETLALQPADLRRKITDQSRMVLVTHMFGIPADMEAIGEICRQRDLLLFEDCAHGVGTRVGGRSVGNAGAGALFSFGPQKLLTCFGGGMLSLSPELCGTYKPPATTASWFQTRLSTWLKSLVALGMSPAVYGWTLLPLTKLGRRLATWGIGGLAGLLAPSRDLPTYRFRSDKHTPFRPFMMRLCERQLSRLEANVAARREVVRRIKGDLPESPGLDTLDEDRHGTSNGSYFGIYVPNSEHFTRFLASRGVEVNPHEFLDCGSLDQFSEFAADCPEARYATRHLVRLPSYPGMTEQDLNRMSSAIRDYFAQQDVAGADGSSEPC